MHNQALIYNGSNVIVTSRRDITVAVHVRIGDVVPFDDGSNWKWVPLNWYQHLLIHLRSTVPIARIHIFTSLLSMEERHANHTRVTLEAQHMFSAAGYQVHISDESSVNATADAYNVLSHFARSDILITAKSSYSIAAGYLNPNCVLYIPTNHQPLAGWIIVPEDKSYASIENIISDDLLTCLQNIGAIDIK